MGRVTQKGLQELVKKMEALEKDTTEIAKRAVYEGAAVLADEIKARLEGNLIGSEYSTGDLVDSFGITPIRVNDNGDVDAKIGFTGYDRKGVPNQLKAAAMESGTSKQPKRPFFRPGVKAAKKKAVSKAALIIEQGIEQIMKKG